MGNDKLPPEDNDIFSAAASEAPVIKDNLVALSSAAKVPSEIAAMDAANKMASVPEASSGAVKFKRPKTLEAVTVVSEV